MESRFPTLQADSLPAEPQVKRRNTGVGSLSLLQQTFPDPGFEPESPALQVDSLPGEPRGKPLKVGRTQQFLLIPTRGCDIAEKSEITRKDLQL